MTTMFSKEFLTSNYSALIDKLQGDNRMGNEGATIVLEMNPENYLLSHIAHLIEQNNAQLLNAVSLLENGRQIVVLNIDAEDATNVIRSLERFEYNVIDCRQKQQLTDETMQKRLDELIYYLEL
ncbi:MAG: hypothetical protein LBV57_05085 [Candidatus Symbiothrix sp.]|jgi:hypothetical protein|nr:hypothetical protein [Candidatus Symbiothrix sp.]